MSTTRIKIEHFITSATASVVLLGAVYMKFFWDKFGINAFDFATLYDIGLATSGQLMMVIYTLLISFIGIYFENRIRDKPFTHKYSTHILLLAIFIIGYLISLLNIIPWPQLNEVVAIVSLLSFVILSCIYITKYVNSTTVEENIKGDKIVSVQDRREMISYWLVVLVLIAMSYFESKDDSNDVVDMIEYSYVLKTDLKILPADTMIFIGRIGQKYFFKEHNTLVRKVNILSEEYFKSGMQLVLYSGPPKCKCKKE